MSSSKFKPTRARPRNHSPSEDEHRDATRWSIDDRARTNLDLESGLRREATSSWRRRMAPESVRGCDREGSKRAGERDGGPGASLAKQSETPPPPYLHSSSHSSQHPLVLHRHAYPQLWSSSTTAVFVPVQLPVIPVSVAVVAADYTYPASNSTHHSTRNDRSSISYGSHDLSSVSLTRARIKALEAQVPHIPQPSQWDCGLACVSMVLKSLRLFSHSDPLDLRMFVHRDAVQLGSVWTIDLAYLLKAFGVTDFTYYTTYIGVNYNYASKQFYKNAFQTDSRRIHSLFADAQDNGVRVVPLLLPLDDMKRFLMSGRYAVLMLVNLSSVQCRVCRRKAIRAEKKRRKDVWSQRWRTVGLSWLCGNPVPPSEPMDMSGCFDDGLLDHARHQDGYLFCDVNMHAVVSESRRKRQKGKKKLQGQSSTFSRQNHMTNFQDTNYPTVQIPSTDRTPLLQKQQSPTVLSDYQSVRSVAALEVIPPASMDETPAPAKKPAVQEPNASCSPIDPPEQHEPAERDSWHIPPGITIAAVENLESEFSVVKTVSSAVTWLGAIVFGGPLTESSASLDTSPSPTESSSTTNSAPSPSTASPVSTSKKRHPPPPGVQISAYSQDNDELAEEEQQSPDLSPSRRRAKPPGVGVVSKVDDESMNRLYILNQGMRRASGTGDNPLSSGRMDSGVGGFGGSKSQPASKSGSPLRPSVLANHAPVYQKHQQSSQRSASPVSPHNLNDRAKLFSNATAARNVEVTASTAKTSPTLLSFLTPSMRSPQKHRAFSIPGTDSEMALAAAAAASSVSSNAAASKAAMESHGFRHPKTVVAPLSRRDGSPGPSPPNPSLADSSRTTIEKRSVWFRDSVGLGDGRDVSGEGSGGSKREEIFARRGVVFSESERDDGTLAREAATAAEHTSRRGSVSFWGGVLGTATAQSSPQGAGTRDEDDEDDGDDDDDDDGFESAEGEFGGVDDEEDADAAFEDVDDAQLSDDWSSNDSSSDSDESLKTATCWSGFTACMPRSSVRRSSSQMHLSQSMTASVDSTTASPLRRGNSSSSLSSGGGFSRFFQRSGATPSNTEQEEFVGHYVLFIGYDAKTDGFIYRDPGIEERLCVMSGSAVEFARSGIPGSDHDVIVVRAGV
ncbi:hypothetical protein HDU81_011100 [Chytriomyces hyalinus]|nr:hypothetical protein HDU81_011100 [Chytriomyces hyalinus]